VEHSPESLLPLQNSDRNNDKCLVPLRNTTDCTELVVAAAGVANATNFFFHWQLFFTVFTEILVLATKSENWGPAGPRFFS